MWSCWNFEIIIWRSLYSTTTTYTTTTIIGNFFFFILHVFLSLLNNYILLDYVTTHGQPLLMQTWYGVDFACFICTWDSRHLTTTATNQAMMKGAATTTQTTHICHIISSVCFFWPFTCFFFVLQTLTEQLYSFRLCYYTWPPPARANTTRGWFCLFYLHSG